MRGRELLPYRAVATLMKPAEYRLCRGRVTTTVVSVLASLAGAVVVRLVATVMSVVLPACLVL